MSAPTRLCKWNKETCAVYFESKMSFLFPSNVLAFDRQFSLPLRVRESLFRIFKLQKQGFVCIRRKFREWKKKKKRYICKSCASNFYLSHFINELYKIQVQFDNVALNYVRIWGWRKSYEVTFVRFLKPKERWKRRLEGYRETGVVDRRISAVLLSILCACEN